MNRILVLGATSAIAQMTIRKLVRDGDHVCLLARDAAALDTVAADLRARRQVTVTTRVADLADTGAIADTYREATTESGTPTLALLAYGSLPDQTATEKDPELMNRELTANFTSACLWLSLLAEDMEQAGSGTLVAIASVAADRGRKSNYTYGAAKAGLATYLAGLRHRLAGSGVHVLTVKPGFVDTPMTADLPKNALYAKPEQVAEDIVKAIGKGRRTLYTPWFWRYIMLIIRCLPDVIFRRLSL